MRDRVFQHTKVLGYYRRVPTKEAQQSNTNICQEKEIKSY
jgi:hypothetical protein